MNDHPGTSLILGPIQKEGCTTTLLPRAYKRRPTKPCVAFGMLHDACANRCTCQPMHETTDAHANRCSCQPMHNTTDARANRCTTQPMHVPTNARHNRCTCQPMHVPTSARHALHDAHANRCTCQPMHMPTDARHALHDARANHVNIRPLGTISPGKAPPHSHTSPCNVCQCKPRLRQQPPSPLSLLCTAHTHT